MNPGELPTHADRAPAALRFTRRDLAILVLAALAFAPALPALAAAWRSAEYHAYAFLVPVVSTALALWLGPTLARVPRRRDPRGLALLAASFALFVAGFLSGTPTAIGIAVVGAVAGTALALRGAEFLRTLAFPIGYLVFMVPLPHSLVEPLIAQLRLFTTELAVGLLQLFSLPVMHEGNVVVLPQERLFVAEACSGIHSVLALLPAAVLLGYFRAGLATRISLVAAVIPIALFWNLVRLLATALAALELPNEAAITGGPLHELAGILTFALGCLSLIGVDAWVRPRPGALRAES